MCAVLVGGARPISGGGIYHHRWLEASVGRSETHGTPQEIHEHDDSLGNPRYYQRFHFPGRSMSHNCIRLNIVRTWGDIFEIEIISELHKKYSSEKCNVSANFRLRKDNCEIIRNKTRGAFQKWVTFHSVVWKHFLRKHGTVPCKSTIATIHLLFVVHVSISLHHRF